MHKINNSSAFFKATSPLQLRILFLIPNRLYSIMKKPVGGAALKESGDNDDERRTCKEERIQWKLETLYLLGVYKKHFYSSWFPITKHLIYSICVLSGGSISF